MLQPKTNVWIEQDGQVVLSRWRVDLLKAIQETGSISAAAEQMHVSYRRAWEKVEEMERGLGQPLLDRQTGGLGGGGASLTPLAVQYVRQFDEFSRGLEEAIRARFEGSFGSGST